MKTFFVRKTLTLLTVLLLFIVSIGGAAAESRYRHPGMVDDLRARFAGARHPQLDRSF